MPRVKPKSKKSAAEMLRPRKLGPAAPELAQPARYDDGTVKPGGGELLAADLKNVVALARLKTEDAVNTLHGMMLDPKCPAGVRKDCANSLLDRGWGTAPKRVVIGTDLGDALSPMEVPTAKLEQLAGELLRRQASIVEATLKPEESTREIPDSSNPDDSAH